MAPAGNVVSVGRTLTAEDAPDRVLLTCDRRRPSGRACPTPRHVRASCRAASGSPSQLTSREARAAGATDASGWRGLPAGGVALGGRARPEGRGRSTTWSAAPVLPPQWCCWAAPCAPADSSDSIWSSRRFPRTSLSKTGRRGKRSLRVPSGRQVRRSRTRRRGHGGAGCALPPSPRWPPEADGKRLFSRNPPETGRASPWVCAALGRSAQGSRELL